jgi:hypothetical protein
MRLLIPPLVLCGGWLLLRKMMRACDALVDVLVEARASTARVSQLADAANAALSHNSEMAGMLLGSLQELSGSLQELSAEGTRTLKQIDVTNASVNHLVEDIELLPLRKKLRKVFHFWKASPPKAE